MTTTQALIWIAVTTFYGFVNYQRGKAKGTRDMFDSLEEAGVFKNRKLAIKKLQQLQAKKEAEEEEEE